MRLATLVLVLALASVPAAEARTLSWSGRDWHVRQSNGLEGPGPNAFDSSTRSVWVDSSGYLHLKVRKSGRSWLSSEIFSQQPLGAGSYTWVVQVPPALDPNVTLGLFTYQDDTHEYDVELARWGNAADPTNAQYAVQPSTVHRFTTAAGVQTFTYTWSASSITFGGTWDYAGPDFWTGSAPVHLNLWQFQGRPPAGGRDVEVVIRSFNYSP